MAERFTKLIRPKVGHAEIALFSTKLHLRWQAVGAQIEDQHTRSATAFSVYVHGRQDPGTIEVGHCKLRKTCNYNYHYYYIPWLRLSRTSDF